MESSQNHVNTGNTCLSVSKVPHKAHVVYEKAWGEQKIEKWNKKDMTMVTVTETEKLVSLSKKDEGTGAVDYKHSGLSHIVLKLNSL